MNWLTTLWTMIAASSLAIAAVYLFVWLRSRDSIWYLMFVLLTIGIASSAVMELWIMHTETAEEYGVALRWFHVSAFLSVVACTALVHYRFDSDRLWIGQTAVILRGLSLIPNFIYPNLNYIEILEIRRFEVLGEQISVASGVPNPWMLLGQLSLVLMIIYIADAAIATWRKRRSLRQKSLSVVLLMLVVAGTVQAILGFWGIVDMPVIVSPFFIGVAIVMATELSYGILRASDLDRELRESRARLEALAKTTVLREASTAIAHEINQPLAVIHSNTEAAQLLLEDEEPDLNAIREILDDIVKADRRAADVVKRLRALVHRNTPTLDYMDLDDAIEEAARHMRDDFKKHGVTLSIHTDHALPSVIGDHILVVQVLLNLLANARDAVAGISRKKRRVEMATSVDDQFVTIMVRDNGTGLSRNAEEVFDPFMTTKPTGLGMGLAIAKSIVDAHDGRIWAESQSDTGTSFHVSIPRKLATL